MEWWILKIQGTKSHKEEQNLFPGTDCNSDTNYDIQCLIPLPGWYVRAHAFDDSHTTGLVFNLVPGNRECPDDGVGWC